MMTDKVFIPEYSWSVKVIYDFTCDMISVLKAELSEMGCSAEYMDKMSDNMGSCRKNTGFTYSSLKSRASLVVIYDTSDFGEFVNTLVHECCHVCVHIKKMFGIDMTEEEFCYMIGDLSERLSGIIMDKARR